jgi:hypothetical protein
MNAVLCLPIQGISNYADGHKNDTWHLYTALAAATCAQELLLSLSSQIVAQFPLTFSGDALDRYMTHAVSNPNAFSSSEIERLRQTRDSLMERQVFLRELMILKLLKMEDGSRDDMEVVRGEVRRLNNFQTMLQRHLHDLDRILQQHDGLLFSHNPLVREQYRELKAQLRRDAETMRDLDRVAQGSLHTTGKMLEKLGSNL